MSTTRTRIEHPRTVAVRTFADDRGYSYFPEVPLTSEGQLNWSMMYPGVVKAFHYHQKQWDHWIGLVGMMKVVLARPIETPELDADLKAGGWKQVVTLDHDLVATLRDQEENLGRHFALQWHYLGERNPAMVSIPPGVLHGYTTVGPTPCGLLYHVTKQYDAADPDEWRVDWDALGESIWKVENK
jgi:dTDP-4-dehydrorhamnose 3,5-epimerase